MHHGFHAVLIVGSAWSSCAAAVAALLWIGYPGRSPPTHRPTVGIGLPAATTPASPRPSTLDAGRRTRRRPRARSGRPRRGATPATTSSTGSGARSGGGQTLRQRRRPAPSGVEHGAAQPAHVLEERGTGDAAVVDANDVRAGVLGELLARSGSTTTSCVVSASSRTTVSFASTGDASGPTPPRRAGRRREARVEAAFDEIGALHPADREVEAALGDAGGLRVRRHHPGVDPELGDPGGPLDQVGRAPVHVADADRLATGDSPLARRRSSSACSISARAPGSSAAPVGGQRDRAAVAFEEAHLQVAFERLDLLRERRARDVQTFGGAAEVQFLGDGDEVAQLAKLHGSIVGQ